MVNFKNFIHLKCDSFCRTTHIRLPLAAKVSIHSTQWCETRKNASNSKFMANFEGILKKCDLGKMLHSAKNSRLVRAHHTHYGSCRPRTLLMKIWLETNTDRLGFEEKHKYFSVITEKGNYNVFVIFSIQVQASIAWFFACLSKSTTPKKIYRSKTNSCLFCFVFSLPKSCTANRYFH